MERLSIPFFILCKFPWHIHNNIKTRFYQVRFILLLEVRVSYQSGAYGRTRTDTVLLPMDFESTSSADSNTPAKLLIYFNIFTSVCQDFFWFRCDHTAHIIKNQKSKKAVHESLNSDFAWKPFSQCQDHYWLEQKVPELPEVFQAFLGNSGCCGVK